mgnify:CR=1 FL=1
MGGAHIGVLDVLTENGIYPDIVVGSSAGAAVGALYATATLEKFKKLISGLTLMDAFSRYADPVFPVSGLFAGKKARKFLSDLFGDARIEDLPVHYIAVATDILTGETVPITKGSLVDAVMASISMPGILKPVILGDRILTDGGVSDPLPLDVLKDCSPDITIACNLHSALPEKLSSSQCKAIVKAQKKYVDEDEDISSWLIDRLTSLIRPGSLMESTKALKGILSSSGSLSSIRNKDTALIAKIREQMNQGREKISTLFSRDYARMNNLDILNIFEIMLNATNIQQYQKNRLMLMHMKPDILIEPQIRQVRSLEFDKGESTIDEGRKRAMAALPAIKGLIDRKKLTLSGDNNKIA